VATPDDLRAPDTIVLVAGWDDEYLLEAARLVKDGSSILVNMETVSPRASLEAGMLVGKSRYVEAPVAAGPGVARRGQLPVIVAYWDRAAWEKARPAIEALAAKIVETGEPPTAMVVKLAFNNLLFTIVAGFSESVGLVASWGIDPAKLRELMESTWMRVIVERYWERGMKPGHLHFRLAGTCKDLRYAHEAALEKGWLMPASYGALTDCTRCLEEEGGDVDYTSVLRCAVRRARR